MIYILRKKMLNSPKKYVDLYRVKNDFYIRFFMINLCKMSRINKANIPTFTPPVFELEEQSEYIEYLNTEGYVTTQEGML